MVSSYFPPITSDQKPYYSGYGSHTSYQSFVPTRDPSFSHESSEFYSRMERGRVDANLSLGIGRPQVEQSEDKKRGEKIDINIGDDVDLELRLGHHP